jgi:hypothetical protein
MICSHMDPATADPCCLYYLHNARHRAADGHQWGNPGPHDVPTTRETDALWRSQHLAALREPQGEAMALFTPAPAQIPGQLTIG